MITFDAWIIDTIFKIYEVLDLQKRGKSPNTEFFIVSYFPAFGLNTGKYRPENTPYLEAFQAVTIAQRVISDLDTLKKSC